MNILEWSFGENTEKLQIVLMLTMGFALASLLGYLMLKIKLSPIVGYLLAGYFIGPFFPGFTADLYLAEQLAEIGIILMMFGVGLHFKLEDLMRVKNIAIPGALGQTLVAMVATASLMYLLGWPLDDGIIIGLAIGVASTVVLIRVLSDLHLLQTHDGHIAIGWLIVEDILTVIVLIFLPVLAEAISGNAISASTIFWLIGAVIVKFALLALIILTVGRKLVTYVLTRVARTRSQELFTLSILALTFVIATVSALIFGASIALGAFLAGMIIGQTDVRHQASAQSIPMKDAFIVIFFLTVGMLFNPIAIVNYFPLFLVILSMILIVKPLTAFLIVIGLKQPTRTALIAALSLAQIGEFSFILAEEALKLKIIPDEAYDIVVACSIISIALNPLLFKCINVDAPYFKNDHQALAPLVPNLQKPLAIIAGFGLIGQFVNKILESHGYSTIIIETNVDTVSTLVEEEKQAIYGDATQLNIIESSHVDIAKLFITTIPDIDATINIISNVRQINQKIKILALIQLISDQSLLNDLDVKYVCSEEETKKALANLLNSTL